MGISFKIAKVGRRYQPEMRQVEDEDSDSDTSNEHQFKENEAKAVREDHVADDNNLGWFPPVLEDFEVSVILNLYTNGFSVGNATELFDHTPKLLLPYDRASEKLFSAIECGCLPGDLFDDIPCKFINGTILCEIRDYRSCFPNTIDADSSSTNCPTIHKVLLRMGMADVVNDISSLSNNSWSYEDLLKFESHVLKALQPDLRLNPNQVLSHESPTAKKLDLEIPWIWKKRRLSDAPVELTISSPLHETYVPDMRHEQNFNSQFNPAFQNIEPTYSQLNMPSSSFSLQGYNNMQENMLQYIPFPSPSNHQVMFNSDQTIPTTSLNPSYFISTPEQSYSNCYSDSVESSMLAFGNIGCSNMQANQATIFSELNEGILDFSKPYLLGSRAETMLSPDVQLKRELAKQRFEDLRILHETLYGNKYYSSDTGLRSGIISQKRKVPENYNVYMGEGSVQAGYVLSDSFPKELSHSAKNILNFCSKSMIPKDVGSSSTINEFIEENPSEEHDDLIFNRFQNILMVTKRYGLFQRKYKPNISLRRNPFSSTNPLVGFSLLNCMKIQKSKDALTDGTFMSKCSSELLLNARTLTFECPPRVNQGNRFPCIDDGDKKKLIMFEWVNKVRVLASVFHGPEEEIDYIDFPFPPTIPSARYADLLAMQFTSLMEREGYTLSNDQRESTIPCTDSRSNCQEDIGGSSRAMMIPFPSSTMACPMSSSLDRQSLSQNVVTAGQLSNLLANNTAQQPIKQHWQHLLNKRAFSQRQMPQIQVQPQLFPEKMVMGGFGASYDCLGTRIQGIENDGLGLLNNNMYGQPFHGLTDPVAAAILASQQHAPRIGVSIQENFVATQMQPPNILDMSLYLTNQQLPEEYVPNIGSSHWPDEPGRTVEHTNFPSPLQVFEQQPQVHLSQLSTGYELMHQSSEGYVAVVPESVEPSSQTHGSVNSNNAGSGV